MQPDLMRIEHDGRSDQGRRDNNEDAWLARPEWGLYAVADGMGGYEGGEVASRVALDSLRSYFELLGPEGLELRGDGTGDAIAAERMALALRIADREVARQASGDLSQMGTTVAALVVQRGRALVAHVGDSRVYRLHEGELEALTRDHSLYAEFEAAGLAGLPPRESFELSNVITQALGPGPAVRPDVVAAEATPGDRFLLCSDGLTDVLDDEAIAWLLTRNRDTASALVSSAYDAGSTDNITALVVTAL